MTGYDYKHIFDFNSSNSCGRADIDDPNNRAWRNAHPASIKEVIGDVTMPWEDSADWAAGRAEACFGWCRDNRDDYTAPHPALIISMVLRELQGDGIIKSVADLVR